MALIITIHVIPRSKTQKWSLHADGNLKCYLKSVPEKGRANQELIALLAQYLELTRASITLIAGHASRKKIVSIDASMTLPVLYERLGVHKQLKLC